jgi:hypothetical protein
MRVESAGRGGELRELFGPENVPPSRVLELRCPVGREAPKLNRNTVPSS